MWKNKMDALTSQIGGSFRIASSPFSTSGQHPRLADYKAKGDGFGDLGRRRLKAIEAQKKRRRDYMDLARRIAEGDPVSESDDDNEDAAMDDWGEDEVDGKMEEGGAQKKSKGTVKRVNPYKDQLMLSEWLVDLPVDFTANWTMLVCPLGRRCMVVASRGRTTAYTRKGYCLKRFPSHLPGGNHTHNAKFTILDCIFNEISEVFYVMDVMCWNSHTFYDSERDLRYFLLKSKFEEEKEALCKRSSRHPLLFELLLQYSCTKESLSEVFSQRWPVSVDGLLFFHLQGHYIRRHSPLCVWLKPGMLNDILKLQPSAAFLESSASADKHHHQTMES